MEYSERQQQLNQWKFNDGMVFKQLLQNLIQRYVKKSNLSTLPWQSSVERKNCAIPGYKGFVPGMKNQTLFGKSFTEQTRDILRSEYLDDTPNLYQSTG